MCCVVDDFVPDGGGDRYKIHMNVETGNGYQEIVAGCVTQIRGDRTYLELKKVSSLVPTGKPLVKAASVLRRSWAPCSSYSDEQVYAYKVSTVLCSIWPPPTHLVRVWPQVKHEQERAALFDICRPDGQLDLRLLVTTKNTTPPHTHPELDSYIADIEVVLDDRSNTMLR